MYKLTATGAQRLADFALIPNCPGNKDWDAYLVWLSAGNTPEPLFTPEELTKIDAQKLTDNLQALWASATAYETGQISGSVTGVLTRGVLQKAPKSVAVQAWVDSIWDLYYQRKLMVSATPDASLNDFSSCGNMPFSVAEINAEVRNSAV